MSTTISQTAVCLDTELRKLRPAELYTLGQILNISDSWKKLMGIVPKEGTVNIPKFNAEHFSMIEQAVHQQKRNAAEIFLEEWGTMGKSRPTLRILLELLVKAELFRAADYVAGDILKGELPKRPEYGPAAAIDISDETIRKLMEEKDTPCNDNFDALPLIFGSSSAINVNKIVYPPDAMLEAANRCLLEGNMQSTQLILSEDKFDEKCAEVTENVVARQQKLEMSQKVEMSDLIKFSADRINTNETYHIHSNGQGVVENRSKTNLENKNNASPRWENENTLLPTRVYENQEMASQELPAFLNEFGEDGDLPKINDEMRSDELPVFINDDSVTVENSSTCDDNSRIFNLNINQNEIMSMELPQFVADLGPRSNYTDSNSANVSEVKKQNDAQKVLASQELPVTVLEYKNG